jgi:hypothetical protein
LLESGCKPVSVRVKLFGPGQPDQRTRDRLEALLEQGPIVQHQQALGDVYPTVGSMPIRWWSSPALVGPPRNRSRDIGTCPHHAGPVDLVGLVVSLELPIGAQPEYTTTNSVSG